MGFFSETSTNSRQIFRRLSNPFQFPLYGIFLWNGNSLTLYTGNWVKCNAFNSLYMGFFSETTPEHRKDHTRETRSFNSLYMGFFSETKRERSQFKRVLELSIPSIWDFSLKPPRRSTSRPCSRRALLSIPSIWDFSLKLSSRPPRALRALPLSIPSIWDFSLKRTCWTI